MKKDIFQATSGTGYYKFGYSALGPLLWGFSYWLLSNVEKEGIKKIFFFSRDGYIMKKAFELIYSSNDIQVSYLEVSRRSLRVPILYKDPSFDNLLTMLSVSKMVSLISIFDAVGLCIDNYIPLVEKYGFSKETIFSRSSINDNESLLRMYDSLLPDILNKSKEEFITLKQYLAQENVCGKFAIVDIGWSGGMQRFLKNTLDEIGVNNQIYGYYTGIASYYKRNIKNNDLNMHGYLFDFKNNLNSEDFRSCFVGLYEMLFLERNGSVIGYQNHGNRIIAKREIYEYGDNSIEVNRIKEVQSGALDFIKDAQKKQLDVTAYDKADIIHNLKYAGTRPSKNALDLFGNFAFYDEGEKTTLAAPHCIIYYLFHPYEFKVDFLKSHWKVGFFRKLFRFPISYYPVYRFLKARVK